MRTVSTHRVSPLLGLVDPAYLRDMLRDLIHAPAGPQVIRLSRPLLPTWAIGVVGLGALVLTSLAFA